MYPAACGFKPNLVTYIHEDDKERPCMIVVPGGGYRFVSPTESEIVAKKFFAKGYNTFVLTYTTNVLGNQPLGKQPMKDLSRAVRLVRLKAQEYHICANKIVVCGFSAGAHLCASLCVHHEEVEETCKHYIEVSNRPDAAILAYPVITSGTNAHKESFTALCGENPSEEELNYMSVEKNVTSETPPCFLWQTADDRVVPVENSYLFVMACQKWNVPYAYHIFSHGIHGSSLADDTWANGEYGDGYTLEQLKRVITLIENNSISVDKKTKKELLEFINFNQGDYQPSKEIAVWPDLAETWLQKILTKSERRKRK